MKTTGDYLKQPLISVLIPTRNRLNKLHKCIESIFHEARDASRVEVVLRVSYDDLNTMSQLPNILSSYPCVRAVIGQPLEGYSSLTQFYDEAACLARGTYIWLFNDDAWIIGREWDERLNELGLRPGEILYAEWEKLGMSGYQNHTGGPFPIILREAWFACDFRNSMGEAIDETIYNDKRFTTAGFLKGVTVNHDRDENEIRNRN